MYIHPLNECIHFFLSEFFGTSVLPGSLQNRAIKDLATEAIQKSLVCSKELGQEKVNIFVEERFIKHEQGENPDVPIHAALYTRVRSIPLHHHCMKWSKTPKTRTR